MIIADLNYLENTSEVIGDLCGGTAYAGGGALALGYGGRSFTAISLRTYAVSSPLLSFAVASAFAVAVVSATPSVSVPT